MFKNQETSSQNIKEAETIIGPSIKVKGNFHGQGNIIIEGTVEGSVKTNGFLLIGDKAKIGADISAKNAKIAGEIKGNVKIEEYLEINASAKINGDISTKKISIEKNAVFNGRCDMSGNALHSLKGGDKQ